MTTHILLLDLGLLFRREVVHDVKQLPDLFGGLTLDHVGHSFTSNITVGNTTRSTTAVARWKEVFDKTPLPGRLTAMP
jgi:hypothetical protein